jgi:hypothetical protein
MTSIIVISYCTKLNIAYLTNDTKSTLVGCVDGIDDNPIRVIKSNHEEV